MGRLSRADFNKRFYFSVTVSQYSWMDRVEAVMEYRSYMSVGFKKGFWRRVRGVIMEYLDGRASLGVLVKSISEEPRARGMQLWEIFDSVRPSDPAKARLLNTALEKCIRLGFITSAEGGVQS